MSINDLTNLVLILAGVAPLFAGLVIAMFVALLAMWWGNRSSSQPRRPRNFVPDTVQIAPDGPMYNGVEVGYSPAPSLYIPASKVSKNWMESEEANTIDWCIYCNGRNKIVSDITHREACASCGAPWTPTKETTQ